MRVVEEAQTFLGILCVFLKYHLFFYFKGETETGKALKLHLKKISCLVKEGIGR